MKAVETILVAAWVLPVHPGNSVLPDHAVVINDGVIVAVVPRQQAFQHYYSDNVVYLEDHAVMPAMVNCHTHLAMSYYRGAGDDMALMTWLTTTIWPAEQATVSAAMVYDGTCHALAESIRGGVGCVNDHYFYAPQVMQAVEEAGMRAGVAPTVFHFGTPWAPTVDSCFKQAREAIALAAEKPFIRAVIGPHSPYGTNDEIMERCTATAAEAGCKVHIHLHETSGEVEAYRQQHGQSPVERFYHRGWLNRDMIAVHMAALSDEEIGMVAESGASVVHCPESNMKLGGDRIAPVQKMLDAGINVALGTDGAASNNDLDMIGEMRTAAFKGKLYNGDPGAVSAADALKMATYNGAKALGIEQETGSLEAGKSADMIAIDLNRPETQPLYNPVSQIVYAASREQVTDMWMGGRQLMASRQLITLDVPTILQRCRGWQKKIQGAISRNDPEE